MPCIHALDITKYDNWIYVHTAFIRLSTLIICNGIVNCFWAQCMYMSLLCNPEIEILYIINAAFFYDHHKSKFYL